MNADNATIDLVFVTYWESSGLSQDVLKQDIDNCLEAKLTNGKSSFTSKPLNFIKSSTDHPTTVEQRSVYTSECIQEQQTIKRQFSLLDKLNFGQMTVYKVRIECTCQVQEPGERCAQFLPYTQQKWPVYMGWQGNGEFSTMN